MLRGFSSPHCCACLRCFSSLALPRLRLRGLPFDATVHDVLGFFNGFRLAATPTSAVQMLRGRHRRPTGQAFAYFDDVIEAMRATWLFN